MSDQVLETLFEIKDQLGRLAATQEAANETLQKHFADDLRVQTALHTRLTNIETANATAAGERKAMRRVAGVLGTLAGLASGLGGALIGKHWGH